ncbi:MAG: DUF86 domain-containing protein [Moorella humiferrea]|uniref:DUF86 domain-containing protein n=1 Tax=Neomoorella humiferrea TaxID=676965 RepID=A0A2T0AVT2_9FIRM|nr:DUF86 domain-containing protein [Moorella humiferrea]MBE3572938.1 DUF86 domain-containing protein [Moorella humiferrea]PRR74773.1 hypothetical protein MOHU_07540 [Moorella humiferrea]
MVDAAVIKRKLQQLESYLGQLEKYKHVKASDLEKNMELAWIVEHGLQLSIQVVLDIGTHILAEEGIIVDEYSNIFGELAELGVLPEKFAQDISGMAGFRNILVHEYGKVDMEKVADIMNHHLDDFRQYARYIVKYLGWSF